MEFGMPPLSALSSDYVLLILLTPLGCSIDLSPESRLRLRLAPRGVGLLPSPLDGDAKNKAADADSTGAMLQRAEEVN